MTEPNSEWSAIHAKLSEPFAPERVHWRVGSTTQDKKRGMALAYIDARDVMDRLDEVVGSGNWETRFRDAAGRVVCELTICGVTKSDGAGDTAVEAEKGGISDAFKRAAVHFGIGRYLYRLAAPWVELDAAGGEQEQGRQCDAFHSSPRMPTMGSRGRPVALPDLE